MSGQTQSGHTLPNHPLTKHAGQPSSVGQVSEQPGTDVTHHARPPPVTMIFGHVAVNFTQQVPSVTGTWDSRQALSSQIRGHFFVLSPARGQPLSKGRG